MRMKFKELLMRSIEHQQERLMYTKRLLQSQYMIIRKNTATLTKSCNMLNFIIILTAGPLDPGSGKRSIAEPQQLKCKERLDKTVLPLLHNSRENKPQPMQPERESTRD